ncbi:glycosyltransferase family 2 protein [Microvirga rosea]|uniref:glycosyltransferase family 2 protein n=1 Tax=Microvirga rosea TaxID=2715425 RepID=UPI001D0A0334|nr:hypothetical protein [Microvirga rosea]MCB8820314.1 hypothetical protein [Microvirga rosea]
MITVLIRARRGPEALAVTLSALVPAVAAGLVADAVILTDKQDDAVDRVADASGATLTVSSSWADGAKVARHEWLLLLDDGDIPQEGWIRVLERFVGLGGHRAGLGRLRRHGHGIHALIDAMKTLLRRRGPRAGDLVHRRILLDGARVGAPVRLPAAIARDPVFG